MPNQSFSKRFRKKRVTTRPKPVVRNDPYKSKLERWYAAKLDRMLKNGEILSWKYEEIKFRLGKGAWYTPDFYVVFPDRIEIHETKGRWMEAAKVRFKVVADKFPEFIWYAVYGAKNGWKYEEFGEGRE